jgi:hypothetical protein
VGKDFNGDVPLSKKILAGLTTGEHTVESLGNYLLHVLIWGISFTCLCLIKQAL